MHCIMYCSNGVSVLHCAVANEHTEIVGYLLKAGSNINVQGSQTHRTPLFLAVDVGNKIMVDLLLKYGANANKIDDFGEI